MAKRRRLKTMQDLRRYLANLINRAEAGEVEPSLASKLCYIANSLAKEFEMRSLKKKIEKLERLLEPEPPKIICVTSEEECERAKAKFRSEFPNAEPMFIYIIKDIEKTPDSGT